MEYRRLGKTNLEVSLLSLGSGGPNQFGQVRHVRRSVIKDLVRQALDLGINFFDTASVYRESEAILGQTLHGVPRDRYLLATKIFPQQDRTLMRPEQVRPLIERSLRSLRVDQIDLLQLQRVTPETYSATLDRLMEELDRLRSEGKFRFLGVTESSLRDPEHRMLDLALRDDIFDTIMLAYDLNNASAADTVLPIAKKKDIGVIAMAAARRLVPRSTGERLGLLSRALLGLVTSPPAPNHLTRRLQGLASMLRPGPAKYAAASPRASGGEPLRMPAAGYTFAVSHPGISTVLTGTNNPAHLQENLAAALAPPLEPEEIEGLRSLLRSA